MANIQEVVRQVKQQIQDLNAKPQSASPESKQLAKVDETEEEKKEQEELSTVRVHGVPRSVPVAKIETELECLYPGTIKFVRRRQKDTSDEPIIIVGVTSAKTRESLLSHHLKLLGSAITLKIKPHPPPTEVKKTNKRKPKKKKAKVCSRLEASKGTQQSRLQSSVNQPSGTMINQRCPGARRLAGNLKQGATQSNHSQQHLGVHNRDMPNNVTPRLRRGNFTSCVPPCEGRYRTLRSPTQHPQNRNVQTLQRGSAYPPEPKYKPLGWHAPFPEPPEYRVVRFGKQRLRNMQDMPLSAEAQRCYSSVLDNMLMQDPKPRPGTAMPIKKKRAVKSESADSGISSGFRWYPPRQDPSDLDLESMPPDPQSFIVPPVSDDDLDEDDDEVDADDEVVDDFREEDSLSDDSDDDDDDDDEIDKDCEGGNSDCALLDEKKLLKSIRSLLMYAKKNSLA